MKLIKTLKNFTILEILVFLLLILLIYMMCCNIISKKECFENSNINRELIKKSGSELFDTYYINIYDDLVYSKKKHDFEINKIINTKVDNTDTESKLLDIGCGTGHLVNSLNSKHVYSIGIDKSDAMIKKAKENYPDNEFHICDALTSLEFPHDTFTHITCLHYTIYYIQDKRQFFENCHNWLVQGGALILHLVDIKSFDPIVPLLRSNKETNFENVINFQNMNYKSKFNIDDSKDSNTISLDKPNAVFKEVIKHKNSNKTRINEHELYMSTQRSILSAAKDAGFTLEKVEEMKKINYENNYIYILRA